MFESWYLFVAIPAAAFLVNGIPHFVKGVSGEEFPTPFSGGAGTLDTPVRNVFWGAANLVVGGVLLWTIREGLNQWLLVAELVVVATVVAALLGKRFFEGRIDREIGGK